jgi:glycosyltransferase 2 family protein
MSRWVKFGVSLAITIGCLWWTFRGANVDEMLASLRSADWFWLGPYFLFLTAIHIARTLRWGNLMSGLEHVSFKKLNEASAIGFMMLIILPFRLGEFARPLLIAQRSSIRRSSAMTSVVLERIVDGVAIAVLLRVLMFFIPGESDGISRIRIGANLMFLVFFSGLLFLVLARWQHDRVVGLMRATAGRVAPGLTERAIGIVDGFVGALKQLPDGKNLAQFFMWTVVYWALNGWGMSMMANAFDCGGGAALNCTPLHITVFQGFVVLCVLIVGMMIPAAPGSAGTFQAFILLALSVFVAPEIVNSGGVAFANVLWVVQMVQQVIFGLVFMVLSHSSFAEIAGKLSTSEDQAPSA